jgi:hypothetical protein
LVIEDDARNHSLKHVSVLLKSNSRTKIVKEQLLAAVKKQLEFISPDKNVVEYLNFLKALTNDISDFNITFQSKGRVEQSKMMISYLTFTCIFTFKLITFVKSFADELERRTVVEQHYIPVMYGVCSSFVDPFLHIITATWKLPYGKNYPML